MRQYPIEVAEAVAKDFVAAIADAVVRVDICGSIRRKKETVSDIEIVCEPVLLASQHDLFGNASNIAPVNRLHARLNDMVASSIPVPLEIYHDDYGRSTLGTRYRRYVFRGMPLDLFLVDSRGGKQHYGAIKAIRTGSAEFVKGVVTSRQHGGFMPEHMRQSGGQLQWLNKNGEWIPYPYRIETEEQWFSAIGVRTIPPRERDSIGLALLQEERGRVEAATE